MKQTENFISTAAKWPNILSVVDDNLRKSKTTPYMIHFFRNLSHAFNVALLLINA